MLFHLLFEHNKIICVFDLNWQSFPVVNGSIIKVPISTNLIGPYSQKKKKKKTKCILGLNKTSPGLSLIMVQGLSALYKTKYRTMTLDSTHFSPGLNLVHL